VKPHVDVNRDHHANRARTHCRAAQRQRVRGLVLTLRQSKPWSLFNSEIRDARFAALRRLASLAEVNRQRVLSL
jgi:RNA-splicing ligase RtcB